MHNNDHDKKQEEHLISEEFLDTYEGEVLFLSQDLEEIVEQMQSDDFSQETLEILQQKLDDVSDVFLSSTYTQHVSPIFKELAEYVAHIEVEDFSKFSDAKNYLCEIVSDVNTYINFYFVERTFSDVYLFQDSLKNSIEFLKRAYSCDLGECEEDDGSELDFF
jgi:hypothetical protein